MILKLAPVLHSPSPNWALMNGDVKRVLRSIELEPSRQGALARLLLAQDNLLRAIENDRDARPAETESEKLAEADRQMAAAQLEILALEKSLEDKEQHIERLERIRGNRSGNHPLIDELLQRIERFYVDPSKVEKDELITAAAKRDGLQPRSLLILYGCGGHQRFL